MITLTTSKKAQETVAKNIRSLRLEKGLTQQGLSDRSGVKLATLRQFEQKGKISIESFFKLAIALGCIDKVINATQPTTKQFSSIDDVLDKTQDKKRQRGWRK